MPATPALATLLTLSLVACVLTKGQSSGQVKGELTTSDPHGGVQMGVPNDFCDNGKDYIYLDWDPKSTAEYTCTEGVRPKGDNKLTNGSSYCTKDAERPVHRCYPGYIEYNDTLPTSGPHRPLWPVYGEYRYVPVQRWLHSLEHGGIVFLYHPCADPGEVDVLRKVATSCLRRHIISPSKAIPQGYNFVLLAWRCKLLLETVNEWAMVEFVKSHARRGPETVASDGQYNAGLSKHAKIVSNFWDDELCPGYKETDGDNNNIETTLSLSRKSLMTSLSEKVKADSKRRRAKAKVVDDQLKETLAKLWRV